MIQNKRVLVVDDEPNIREVVDLYLRRDGFEVEVAADGEADHEAAKQHQGSDGEPLAVLGRPETLILFTQPLDFLAGFLRCSDCRLVGFFEF